MYILILLFALFAFASNGLAKLYLYLIRKGQLFSFMQKPIVYLQDKKNPLAIFAYKSIGGCEVCTIQRLLNANKHRLKQHKKSIYNDTKNNSFNGYEYNPTLFSKTIPMLRARPYSRCSVSIRECYNSANFDR